MGCLNANQGFEHWFGNIHLSGPCNRSCYFCIGQHMMALDHLNNLDTWPLKSLGEFIETCGERGVTEVNLTGTNTDPLLCKHLPELRCALEDSIPGLTLGIRSNGVLLPQKATEWQLFDKGSITLCSLDPKIYKAMMGQGSPPDIDAIMKISDHMHDLKVNIVLGPENTSLLGYNHRIDIWRTLHKLREAGFKKVNLREPYGQPHVGDVLALHNHPLAGERLGMPFYDWRGMDVMYWDVHYVEVESVNLYASGRVSETYPITQGHDEEGYVLDQSHYKGGRVQDQWLRDKEAAEDAAKQLRTRLID